MTNNSSTHNTLMRRAMSKLAPPNSYRSIRYNLLLLPIAVMAFIAVTALSSCSGDSEAPVLDIMGNYYKESCGLRQVPGDSIQRFATKVVTYVNHYPEEKSSPYYPDIVANIKDAARAGSINIVVTINTEWDRDTTIYF